MPLGGGAGTATRRAPPLPRNLGSKMTDRILYVGLGLAGLLLGATGAIIGAVAALR